jgi:hypothetical protein
MEFVTFMGASFVPEKQIVVAAGEGAKAPLQAHRYLQRLNNKEGGLELWQYFPGASLLMLL